MSKSWKNAESQWAKILGKFKVPAQRRVSRMANYRVSEDDVEVIGHPEIISDSKYSIHGFKVNRLLEVVREKYEKNPGDISFLLTKGYKERGMKATVDAEVAAMLLSYWLGNGTKEELMEIYLGK